MLTDNQYSYLQQLKPHQEHTRWIRSQYQGADDARVTIAWFAPKRRWVICRVVSESVLRGQEFQDVTVLKPLSVWQGPGDTYLPVDQRMVQWLRSHDTYNAKDYGTWSDAMFSEPQEEDRWDSITEMFKDIYDQNKSEIQSTTSPARENGNRKHFYEGCLLPDRSAPNKKDNQPLIQVVAA